MTFVITRYLLYKMITFEKKEMKKLFIPLCFCCVFWQVAAQCWTTVSAGYSQIIAIADDGSMWAWGLNRYGELGTGNTINSSVPIQVGTDNDWVAISAGQGPQSFNLAQKADGTLWSWGRNSKGQLGDGTNIDKSSPVQIGSENDWISFSAGYGHALAVRANGTCWSWGGSNLFALGNTVGYGGSFDRNLPAQVGTDTNWLSVSAGDDYSLAMKTNRTVWGWGSNTGNPLGMVTASGSIQYPTLRNSANNSGNKDILAGGTHSFTTKLSNNLIVAYGSNVYGQSGGTSCAGCPIYFAKNMECGDDTTGLVKTDGTLWFSGKRLGYLTPTVSYESSFTQFGNSNNWKMVSVGFSNAAAVNNLGQLFTWGWNNHGTLGNGTVGYNLSSESLVLVTCPAQLLATSNFTYETFSVYPNPATNELFVSNPENKVIKSMTIVDVSGKVLTTIQDNFQSIDVSQFERGIYILVVEGANYTKQFKFTKQ